MLFATLLFFLPIPFQLVAPSCRLRLAAFDLLIPYRLLLQIPNKVLNLVELGPPSNTLTPIGHSARVASANRFSRVTKVLQHFFVGEGAWLRSLCPLVVNQSGSDTGCGCAPGVFARNTEVEAGSPVTDIASLGTGVHELVQLCKV